MSRSLRSRLPRGVGCTLFENDAKAGPCEFSSFHQNKPCSGLAYFLAAACDSCSSATSDSLSYADYARANGCGKAFNPNPSPLPSGTSSLPSWALAMAEATPLPTAFDFTEASNLAASLGGISTSPTSSTPLTQNFSPKFTAIESEPAAVPSNSSTSEASISTSGSSKLHAGAIVGILFGVLAVVAFAAFLLLRARYHQQQRRLVARGFTELPSPIEKDLDLPVNRAPEVVPRPYPFSQPSTAVVAGSSAGPTRRPRNLQEKMAMVQPAKTTARAASQCTTPEARREYLENELRSCQQRMLHIQNHLQRAASVLAPMIATPATTGSGSNGARTATEESSSTVESDVVSRLREQNEGYQARIQELEAQMMSPWALGLSDEPPPGYFDS
ncbi:hypothetical protein FB45DRAFT_363330 [Roridomyces roridus]|uniref:Transmembrane protein n=1 Tax=Roridomyces roridus TaxID=1738132 RepID=A0AAD7FTJ1_9AGAR|nr:hypothetical protein FB45DRAFT_363330 [Roridomyces roridus]